MQRLFEEGLRSAVNNVKQKRVLLVLSLLIVLVPILVALLVQASPMQASDIPSPEIARVSEENVEYLIYLPMVVGPPAGPPPLPVADFRTCDSTNNLGGAMGAAYISPSNLVIESYVEVPDPPGGCEVYIEYHIKDWGAFWLQLEHADLSEYSLLFFDIMGDASVGVPAQMKIEIKRDCQKVGGSNQCNQIDILYFAGVTGEWQRNVNVALSDFTAVDWPGYMGILDWSDIEELVFTFEAHVSGQDGAIYLDNIQFGN